MNQLDQGSLKLMPRSISYPNIEQRLPKMMQQARGSEQLATAILQIALNNSDSSTILSDLATTICRSFTANGCVVISQETNSVQTNQIGYWQETGLLTESAIEQLSSLSIHQDLTPSSSQALGLLKP